MKDIRNPRWMWLKGALFVAIGLASATLLILESPGWKVAALLTLAVWAFCRAYYFAFYVIERYVDPSYKFSGLLSFVAYWFRRKDSA